MGGFRQFCRKFKKMIKKMKAAIIYTSKYGTTERVAVSIAEKLKEKYEVELFSLKKTPKPNISEFELVILGSSIYVGQSSKKIKDFCKTNEPVLLQKKTGLFVCGMHIDEVQQRKELTEAFPEVLYNKTLAAAFLGGAFLFEKMNFFERAIIKKIAKTTTSVERIEWEALELFVGKLIEK
jgi:menaquinone-dependent protoporphyrinogen oxidase